MILLTRINPVWRKRFGFALFSSAPALVIQLITLMALGDHPDAR